MAGSDAPATELGTIATLALVLDGIRVDRNIVRLRTHLAPLGVTLRLHLKNAKSIDVARRLFSDAWGPITVSTLAEADAVAVMRREPGA